MPKCQDFTARYVLLHIRSAKNAPHRVPQIMQKSSLVPTKSDKHDGSMLRVQCARSGPKVWQGDYGTWKTLVCAMPWVVAHSFILKWCPPRKTPGTSLQIGISSVWVKTGTPAPRGSPGRGERCRPNVLKVSRRQGPRNSLPGGSGSFPPLKLPDPWSYRTQIQLTKVAGPNMQG
jgi:hypothetical protein